MAIAIGCAAWWAAASLIFGRAQVDLGGNVAAYWAAAQTDERPIRGVCASACSMRLLHARCVDPDAMLIFHAATQPLGTRLMWATYRPRLRKWLLERGGLSERLIYATGRDLIALGWRGCANNTRGTNG